MTLPTPCFELGSLEIRNAPFIGNHKSEEFSKTLTELLQEKYPGIEVRYTFSDVCPEYGVLDRRPETVRL